MCAKHFPLKEEFITIKVMVLSSLTKCQHDSQPLICFMWNDKRLYNLDLFFHVAAKEMPSVVRKAREVNADGLVEFRDTQG